MARDVQYNIGNGKPIIFWISNSWNMNTGYAKCCREICHRLGKDFEVLHLGQHSLGDAYKPEGWDFSVHPLKDDGLLLLPHQIAQIKPAAILIQDDLFPLVDEKVHEIDFSETKLIMYAATDGEPLADNAHLMLDKCNQIVAMTNWGKEVIEREGYEDVAVIYHGVDTNVWKPMDRNKMKKDLSTFLTNVYHKPIDVNNKFIVFTSGRNSMRKNMPDSIMSFMRFAKDKPDALMIIHSIQYDKGDSALANYVIEFAKQLGMDIEEAKKKVIFYPAQSFQRACPESQMVALSNVADVYFTMAYGEGFGMQMLEAMACGTPVISSEYSTPTELVGTERGFLIKANRMLYVTRCIGHKLCDLDDAVLQLNKAYGLWKKGELRDKFSKNCIDFAQKHTWDLKVKEWKNLINEVISQ